MPTAWRHTISTKLSEKNGIEKAQKFFRHSSSAVTKHYVHVLSDYEKALIKEMEKKTANENVFQEDSLNYINRLPLFSGTINKNKEFIEFEFNKLECVAEKEIFKSKTADNDKFILKEISINKENEPNPTSNPMKEVGQDHWFIKNIEKDFELENSKINNPSISFGQSLSESQTKSIEISQKIIDPKVNEKIMGNLYEMPTNSMDSSNKIKITPNKFQSSNELEIKTNKKSKKMIPKMKNIKKLDKSCPNKEFYELYIDQKVCKVCNKGDNENELLLCDMCDDAYHFRCLSIKIFDFTEERKWFCLKCLGKDIYDQKTISRIYSHQLINSKENHYKNKYFEPQLEKSKAFFRLPKYSKQIESQKENLMKSLQLKGMKFSDDLCLHS